MADRPVRQLRLLGRTRDGSALVMEAAGERFVLPVDDNVLLAMGAPAPEPPAGEALSPRTIQARIRRGESSAAIAVDAGMDVTVVARFEGPVVAERAHQAARAAATVVRGRPLLERIDAHRGQGLAEGLQLVVEAPRLDAWLSEDDSHWVLQAVWPGGLVARWQWRPGQGALVAADPLAREISEEPARREDDLEAVLRPLRARPGSGGSPDPAMPGPAREPASRAPARNRRSTVPSWDEITSGQPEPR